MSEAYNTLADRLMQMAANPKPFSGNVGYQLKYRLYQSGLFKQLLWAWVPKWLDGMQYLGTEVDEAYELSVLADLCLRKAKSYKKQEKQGKIQFTYITRGV